MCMRTTLELSDVLAEQAKALAKKRGSSMKALIEEGLRKVVEEEARRERNFQLRDASVDGGGLAPGVELEWGTIRHFLYPEPDSSR